MRSLIGIGLAFSLLLIGHASAGDKTATPFEIAGVCTIDPPGPGFTWKVVKTLTTGTIKGHICMAKDEDAAGVVVMIVEQRTATKFADRSALLKANWDALVAVKEKGYTDLKEKAPELGARIADETFYGIDAKNKEGVPTFVRGATLFKKFTYNFQVISKDKATADRLVQVVKTVKEAK